MGALTGPNIFPLILLISKFFKLCASLSKFFGFSEESINEINLSYGGRLFFFSYN